MMTTNRYRALPHSGVFLLAALLGLALVLAGCSKKVGGPKVTPPPPRTYLMGFSGIPPRADFAQQVAAIDMWGLRADGAIMSDEVPWDSLLAGVRPDSFVMRNQLGLAQYYRGKGHRLVVMIDPANGLNRAGESTPLVNAGRSIAEPAIQQLYRRYAVALDTLLRPDELGLALETNLIRLAAPAPLYAAVRQLANDAAADVRAHDASVRLMVSVQVDAAWGRFAPPGAYVGVESDFNDFPFIQVLGLSSYPYLAGYADPESLPADYYSALLAGRSMPVMVTEGGWSSTTVSPVVTSAAMQRRFVIRQAQLLDAIHAIGWFQLTFTDLDLTVFPPGVAPFAYLGLVDTDLNPKLALASWDSVFARPRR